MDPSLQSRMHVRLQSEPDRPAIAFYHTSDRVEWISFSDFYHRALVRAAWLREHGLREGDCCLLIMPSDERLAVLVPAVLLAGGTPLLMAPPVHRIHSGLIAVLRHVLRTVRPRLVVAAATLRHEREIVSTRGGVLFDDDPPDDIGAVPPPVFPRQDAVAALQLTSGTTGLPRVCVWQQKNVVAALDSLAHGTRLAREDVCFNWTPLYHDMGLVNNFLLCLTHGTPLALMNPLDFVARPGLWLRGLHATGATTTWSPNFGFALTARRATESDLAGIDLAGVRSFWNAAERIHLETMQAFHRRFAALGLRADSLRTNFGCAENIGGATFSDVDATVRWERVDAALLYSKGVARPSSGASATPPADAAVKAVTIVSAGRPTPGTRIQICSRAGRALPEGRVGEVAVDSPSRMTEYLGNATETRRVLRQGLLWTGDLGYLRDGELFWVGRVRERINTRGQKLDPSALEPILLHVPGVRPGCFAAFGVDDDEVGSERLVVVVELTDPPPVRDVGESVRSNVYLQLGVWVDEVIALPKGTLAKTSSGKRRHGYFRRQYVEGRLAPVLRSAPAASADEASAPSRAAHPSPEPARTASEGYYMLSPLVRLEIAERSLRFIDRHGTLLLSCDDLSDSTRSAIVEISRRARALSMIRRFAADAGQEHILRLLLERQIIVPAPQRDCFDREGLFFAVVANERSRDLTFQFRGGESDLVNGVPPEEFAATIGIASHTLVALRDLNGHGFYQRVSRQLPSFEHLVAWQLGIVAALGRDKAVNCMGSSMGGYAAILSGTLIAAERVIAFSPVQRPDDPVPLCEQVRRHDNGVTRYDIWYGTRNERDCPFALTFTDLPRCTLHPVDTDDHLPARVLWERHQLPRLFPADTERHASPAAGPLDREQVRREIQQFIADRLLRGKPGGLDAATPLLELGLLDSFNFIVLVAFINERFGVALDLTAHARFTSAAAIADLVSAAYPSRTNRMLLPSGSLM